MSVCVCECACVRVCCVCLCVRRDGGDVMTDVHVKFVSINYYVCFDVCCLCFIVKSTRLEIT